MRKLVSLFAFVWLFYWSGGPVSATPEPVSCEIANFAYFAPMSSECVSRRTWTTVEKYECNCGNRQVSTKIEYVWGLWCNAQDVCTWGYQIEKVPVYAWVCDECTKTVKHTGECTGYRCCAYVSYQSGAWSGPDSGPIGSSSPAGNTWVCSYGRTPSCE